MKNIDNSGVYQIRNVIDNKRYVGSSINLYKRWRTHKWMLRKGIHHSIYLQNTWNKNSEKSLCLKF